RGQSQLVADSAIPIILMGKCRITKREESSMASPWPDQPCPHLDCGRHIRDLLAEMVPNEAHSNSQFQALVSQKPGGAITCPYCQRAVEYHSDGKTLVVSILPPIRYSRAKMERRARDYGTQKRPPDLNMTPDSGFQKRN